MMKKVITSSALLTGLLLGSFSSITSSTNHTNQNAVAATQVDVKAVDTAVKSLKQVEPVKQPTMSVETVNVSAPVAQEVPATQEAVTPAEDDDVAVDHTIEAATPVQATEVVQQNTENLSVDGALGELIHRESSGNPAAQNGQYYGIGQLSPSNYAKYAAGQDYQNNYDVQLQAMKAYIAERYGSVENALSHHNANGWY